MYLKLIFPVTSFPFLENHPHGEAMCVMAEELRSCGLKICQMPIELGREREECFFNLFPFFFFLHKCLYFTESKMSTNDISKMIMSIGN